MTMTLRSAAPELWHDIVSWCREIGLDWPEEEIANVIGKVQARSPGDLPDTIGRVLEWCRKVETSDDEADQAIVSLWRALPRDVLAVTISEDGHLQHRLLCDLNAEVSA